MAASRIEDIKVEANDNRPCILWRIGAHRFHIWLDRETNEPEEVVYKNSVAKHDEPGHYRTRQLFRTGSRVTAVMFAEVWTVVERDDLIAKAKAAHLANVANAQRISTLKAELAQIEATALDRWKLGHFDSSASALHLRRAHEQIARDIEAIKPPEEK